MIDLNFQVQIKFFLSCYLLVTSGYLVVISGYLIVTTGYFLLLLVTSDTSRYFWFLALVTTDLYCVKDNVYN